MGGGIAADHKREGEGIFEFYEALQEALYSPAVLDSNAVSNNLRRTNGNYHDCKSAIWVVILLIYSW